MLSSNIEALPAHSLRLLSEYIAELADLAEHRERCQRRSEHARSEKTALYKSLFPRVAAYVEAGLPVDVATQKVAIETDVPEINVRANYEHGVRRSVAQKRAERNALILRLAAKGWSNREISRHLGVAPSTITRAIRAQYPTRSEPKSTAKKLTPHTLAKPRKAGRLIAGMASQVEG